MRLAAIACLLVVGAPLCGEEWSRFRGPNGSGVADVKGLPIKWNSGDYAWATALPGRGHSSPVVWGDKIFVTSADAKGTRLVVCVNADRGKILWQKEFAGAGYKMHKRNSAASATPVVDDRRVYLLWARPSETIVQALDHEGNEVWKVDLGAFHSQHGIGVSPIRVNDLVIIADDQDQDGRLVALDAATGKQRWLLPRKSGNATYATPCVYQTPGRKPEVIFTNWQHGITAIDPASGKVSWELSVFEPNKNERSIVSPVLAGDLILGTCGFVTGQKHLVAVRPTPDGKAEEVWRLEKQVPHLPTPVVFGDHLFALTEKGIVSCLEVKTGKLVWQERLENEFSPSFAVR